MIFIVFILGYTVRWLFKGVLSTGESKDSFKVTHGRETLSVSVSDVPENIFKQFRPGQTPTHSHRHGNWELDYPIRFYFSSNNKKSNSIPFVYLEAVRLPNAWLFETLHGPEFIAQARKESRDQAAGSPS